MLQACSDHGNVVRQQLVSVGKSRGCTLMVRGPRHSSLSGVLCGCARLPVHISGGSMDGNQPLLVLSSLSHAFVHPSPRLIPYGLKYKNILVRN